MIAGNAGARTSLYSLDEVARDEPVARSSLPRGTRARTGRRLQELLYLTAAASLGGVEGGTAPLAVSAELDGLREREDGGVREGWSYCATFYDERSKGSIFRHARPLRPQVPAPAARRMRRVLQYGGRLAPRTCRSAPPGLSRHRPLGMRWDPRSRAQRAAARAEVVPLGPAAGGLMPPANTAGVNGTPVGAHTNLASCWPSA